MADESDSFPTDPAIAMVATSGDRLPRAASIVAAAGVRGGGKGGFLRSLFGRGSAPPAEHEWEGPALVFAVGDAQLAVSLMPGPIPWSDLEGPCATTWWWEDAAEQMRSHTHHFLIALIGGSLEPIERRLLLTKVVAAVVAESEAVGVYWGEGTLVHEPSRFLKAAKGADADNIPMPLWVDVRVEPNPDGTSRCFTTGLAALGFLEIEVRNSALKREELWEFVGDIAMYVVSGRKQIPDGDTMGRTADEKYRVRHGKSMFDRPRVMQLIMS